MTETSCEPSQSVLLFLDVARTLSARLRNDVAAPIPSEPVRVHDGATPLAVATERSHDNGSTNVRLHRHLSWQPSLQIDVYGNGSSPSALDLGTDTPHGTADLLDLVVGIVERRDGQAAGHDLMQTAADVCGSLIGPTAVPIIVHAPTPWAPVRIIRADEGPLELPEEATGLLAAIPVLVSPTFWIQDAREDVPTHPRASLVGWSVVAQPTDPMTVTRALLAYPSKPQTAGKAA